MRRFKFFFVPHGPTRMCVYEGTTGRITKHIQEEGTTWPWDFSFESRPIWCGWTTLVYDSYYDFGYPNWTDWNYKVTDDFFGATHEQAAALAWADFRLKAWGGSSSANAMALATLTSYRPGENYAKIDGYRCFLILPMGIWFLNFPGVQPALVKMSFGVRDPGVDRGNVKIPLFDVSVPLTSAVVEVQAEISGVYFSGGLEYLKVEIDPASFGYSIDPYRGKKIIGARVGRSYGGCHVEMWGGGGGWEYIDIPDWIFELPGKYWLAMVDAAGNFLPGPYMPLN